MGKRDFSAVSSELLIGAYDLHVHSAPSAFPRAKDGFELLKEADAAGMAGIMLKSHYESTATRAELINQYSGCKAKAYGSLTLNWPAGGLNIYAVENALKVGAKIIWMPTRDSENSLHFGNMDGDFFQRKGISILNEDGTIKDCVYEIMDAVKRYNAVLATGHLSPEESVLLCRAGCANGVRMVLTHPEFPRTTIAPQVQKELADLGVLIEKTWFNIAHGQVTLEEMVATIRLIGSRRAYITTDRGQKGLPAPAEEYKLFVESLLQAGLTEAELRDLAQIVPKSIVD